MQVSHPKTEQALMVRMKIIVMTPIALKDVLLVIIGQISV